MEDTFSMILPGFGNQFSINSSGFGAGGLLSDVLFQDAVKPHSASKRGGGAGRSPLGYTYTHNMHI